MKEKWNERFSAEEYIFGKDPNSFFKEEISKIQPGKILLPADGEGRNGVYAASLGWKVDAVDFSIEGKTKAEKLAKEKAVIINYEIHDLSVYVPPKNYYDAVGIFYLHMDEDLRKTVFDNLINSLKPNGKLVFESFEKEQIKFNSGGPKDETLLFSLEEIITAFIDLEFETLAKEKIFLNEGKGHEGEGMVIRFVGRKTNETQNKNPSQPLPKGRAFIKFGRDI